MHEFKDTSEQKHDLHEQFASAPPSCMLLMAPASAHFMIALARRAPIFIDLLLCTSSIFVFLSPLSFHKPRWITSTQASCTFSHPWKRPRKLIVPTLLGQAWCTSWKSISFQRFRPPRASAMIPWRHGHARSGSFARKLFHGREWLKFVISIHARPYPQRAAQVTGSTSLQPCIGSMSWTKLPRAQTHAQQKSTKALCLMRRGSHFL
mmetsp:Transcript_7242/g.13066  ORF Transcript_7242/g.13066 Transcript_7242/m.13066 type:complete len:207 (-) Transcript_7242:965-1585(-)